MTADEHWDYALRCPQCGKVGTAHVRELDGWPYMHAVKDGKQFRWVHASDGFQVSNPNDLTEKITCSACGVRPEIE